MKSVKVRVSVPCLLVGLGWAFAVGLAGSPRTELSSDLQASLDTPVETPASGSSKHDVWSNVNNPIRSWFPDDRLNIWSFLPRSRPSVPSVNSAQQEPVLTPIDQFIRARLNEVGLNPAQPANRRTLARRVAQGLTGLPPSYEVVEAFVQDSSAHAYERLVDQLLASPRYGEHQARWWLDVVRYSDSNGFDWDEFRPVAWRFRDYVVRSFNADKPYDGFIQEQVAGDEMLDGPPQNPAQQDALIATGYLRIGPQDNSASLFNEQSRARAELMADLTETTGTAFLGLTLECCRCHNHKTEPISQADHFRFRAFFAGVKYGDDIALDLAADQESIRMLNEKLDREIQPLQEEREQLKRTWDQHWRDKQMQQLTEADRALLVADPETLTEQEITQRKELEAKLVPTDKDLVDQTSEEDKARDKALRDSIESLKAKKSGFTRGLLMTDAPGEPPVQKVHFQGNHTQERDSVEPGIPSIWDPRPSPIQKAANATTTGRRWTLAQWLVDPENPLTARVLVNRIWQQHFGRGLVGTPNDFGRSGQSPSHPELLDWLANRFIESGWSIKQLHRDIVLSATYQQSSQGPNTDADSSDNAWVSRQNLRRLSAEQLRDAVLEVSGLLRHQSGGPPVWPELPADVLQANPAFLDDNAEKTKGWYPSPPEDRTVRTLYQVQKRTVRNPFLETFDLPDNAKSCAQREQSIVAPQALSLLNDPEILQAARALAQRVHSETLETGTDAVERMFQIVLQRLPTTDEQASCQIFLERHSLTALARACFNLNEFVFLD